MEYNEYEEHTLEELRDLLDEKEKELQEQLNAPVNYYIPGDSMTYLSAMSQCWGIESTRDEIREIEAEIDRRHRDDEEE
jgi:hypothetical protein